MGVFALIAVLLAFLGGALWIAIAGWQAHSDVAMSAHGYTAMVLGIVFSLLVGCGLTEFSMTPGALEMARQVIRETSAAEMARIAARVLTLGTVDEIEGFLFEMLGPLGQREKVQTE